MFIRGCILKCIVYLVYQFLLLFSSLSFQNKPSPPISYASPSTISSRAQSWEVSPNCSSYRLAFGFEQTQQTAVGRYGRFLSLLSMLLEFQWKS